MELPGRSSNGKTSPTREASPHQASKCRRISHTMDMMHARSSQGRTRRSNNGKTSPTGEASPRRATNCKATQWAQRSRVAPRAGAATARHHLPARSVQRSITCRATNCKPHSGHDACGAPGAATARHRQPAQSAWRVHHPHQAALRSLRKQVEEGTASS
jgi:hypothetical protein